MGYGGHRWERTDSEKVSKILRSAMQDSCKAFTEETLKPFFPKKMVDDVDIGEVAFKWAWRIVGSLRFKKKIGDNTFDHTDVQEKLLSYIFLKYDQGINLDKDLAWKWLWIKKGLPAFTEWIESFPSTGRISSADKLEKENKKEEIEEWWKT